MEINLRLCKIDDVEAIYLLNKEEMGYDYPLANTRNNLEKLLKDNMNTIIVATIENIVIGYIHYCDYQCIYASPMKNIMGIAVSKKYQNKGIGRKLIFEMEKRTREDGIKIIRLSSGAERKMAHKVYESYGYKGNKNQINMKKYLD